MEEEFARFKEFVALDKKTEEFVEKGDFTSALEAYDQALALQPLNPYLIAKKGNVLLKSGALDAAMAQFKRAIDVDPQFALGYSLLGILFIHLDRYEEAETALQTAIKINPKDKNSRILLSGLKTKTSPVSWERIVEAVETLRMILTFENQPLQLEKILGRLDTDLLALVRANAETARRDGEVDLADGFDKLAAYIDSILAIRILVA